MMRFYRIQKPGPRSRVFYWTLVLPPPPAGFAAGQDGFFICGASMKTSPEGIALIQHFEGCRLASYPDPKTGGDPWTIGWGHTGRDVKRGLVWTQAQADAALENDLVPAEAAVHTTVTVPLTQRQFDALASIIFNVGPGSKFKDGICQLKKGSPSTLVRMINSGNMQAAADQFLRWVSPGSAVETGLRRRRTAERALFLGQSVEAALRAGDAVK